MVRAGERKCSEDAVLGPIPRKCSLGVITEMIPKARAVVACAPALAVVKMDEVASRESSHRFRFCLSLLAGGPFRLGQRSFLSMKGEEAR